MGYFKCCYKCVKRHLGCHAKCKEYHDEKAAFEKLKEQAFHDSLGSSASTDYYNDTVWKKFKIRF